MARKAATPEETQAEQVDQATEATAENIGAQFDAFFEAKADGLNGFEEMDTETMAIPFIKILQDLSTQCKKTHEDFNPEAEPGMLANTVSGKLYSCPLRFVVGKFNRLYTEWKPKRGGYQGSHAPELIEKRIMSGELAPNEKNKLVSSITGNEFVENYVYYIILPDHLEDEVCVMSFSSTQLKAARKLNRSLSTTYIPGTTRKALPYFMVWELTTVLRTNEQGDWYAPVINLHSFVSQALLDTVVEERKKLPTKTLDMSLLEDKSYGQDKELPSGGSGQSDPKAKF